LYDREIVIAALLVRLKEWGRGCCVSTTIVSVTSSRRG
jgi:hypothetical protein